MLATVVSAGFDWGCRPVGAILRASACLRERVMSTEGFEFVGSPNPDVTIGAIVNSHEFASLCFSDAGIYDYTAQREQETKLDGTVMVK